MLQVELYVNDVEQTAALFMSVFGLTLFVEKLGFRHLRHPSNFDIMLFSPSENSEGEDHWALPESGGGGQGIEIVIVTDQVSEKLKAVRKHGYECSELRHTPWGSIEFTFHLKEGYLLRIKEPKATS